MTLPELHIRAFLQLFLLFFIAVTLLSLPFSSYAANIITHPDNQSPITIFQARAIFAGKKRYWSNGNPIRIVIMNEDSPSHERFCRKLLNVFPRQLRRSWDRNIYSGAGEGPVIVNSEQEMLDYISNHPYAIGYTDQTTEKEAIHVISFE